VERDVKNLFILFPLSLVPTLPLAPSPEVAPLPLTPLRRRGTPPLERTNFDFSKSGAPLSPRERGRGRGKTSGEGQGERESKTNPSSAYALLRISLITLIYHS